MKKVIIIGNGFDSAHGLNTKFTHFSDFLERSNPLLHRQVSDTYISNNNDWNIIEDIMSNQSIIDEIAETKISEIYVDDFDFYDGNIWRTSSDIMDVAKEEFIHDIPDAMKVKEELVNWLKFETNAKVIEKYHFFATLFEDAMVINYNYTNTVENVYDKRKKDVFHIHGTMNDYRTIKFGHIAKGKEGYALRDDFGDGFTTRVFFSMFGKYTNNDKKKLAILVRKNMQNVEHITWFGFSFGKQDIYSINEIIKNTINSTHVFYYFTENDKKRIIKIISMTKFKKYSVKPSPIF